MQDSSATLDRIAPKRARVVAAKAEEMEPALPMEPV